MTFDRAAQLAVSEHQTIELDVAEGPMSIRKRFNGPELLSFAQQHGLRTIRYAIYATQRGQYAVYVRDDPDWSRMSGADESVRQDPRTGSESFYETKDKSLQVYPDLEAMVHDLHDDVGSAIRRALDDPAAAHLDI